MSTQTLPTLVGLGWAVSRATQWYSQKHFNVSGTEVSKSRWSYPKYHWQITYGILRTGSINQVTYTEMQQLMGFFNQRGGAADSFLYTDSADYRQTNQFLGIGNGATTVFKLRRQFGAASFEPIYAPNIGGTTNIYLNGVLQAGVNYTVTYWETVNANGPGCVIFNTPPAPGQFVTGDFSYFWPVKFDQDNCEFEELAHGYYKVSKLTFRSLK